MKLRRMIGTQTLALHPVGLDSLNFTNKYGEVTQKHRYVLVSEFPLYIYFHSAPFILVLIGLFYWIPALEWQSQGLG